MKKRPKNRIGRKNNHISIERTMMKKRDETAPRKAKRGKPKILGDLNGAFDFL